MVIGSMIEKRICVNAKCAVHTNNIITVKYNAAWMSGRGVVYQLIMYEATVNLIFWAENMIIFKNQYTKLGVHTFVHDYGLYTF